MKGLQIVDHNINIGHCKVYSRDFVADILWFIKLLKSEFRILNSQCRILNSEIPHFEFRILNPEFRKKVVYRIFVFGDATSWSVHGMGQGIQN